MNYDFLQALEAIARNKGIEQEVLYEALEAGLRAAARRRFGDQAVIDAQVDLEEGRVVVRHRYGCGFDLDAGAFLDLE